MLNHNILGQITAIHKEPIFSNLTIAIALIVMLLASGTSYAGGTTITIINADGPGEGFNDPTPVSPVGGNAGTTRGQQRLIAFQHAANIWGANIDSKVSIVIRAEFSPLASNILGQSGAQWIIYNFPVLGSGFHPGPEFPNTWYAVSLANKRAGGNLMAYFNLPDQWDIASEFNSNFNFYLGLDNNHGLQVDFVTVVLHELAHGFDFASYTDETTGRLFSGFPNMYDRHLLDTDNGLHWNEMTNQQRRASAIKFGRLVWDGPNVTSALPGVLSPGSPEVRIISPASIAGLYQFGDASFAPLVASVTGNVVLALDPLDPPPLSGSPSSTDGCSPLTNAAAIAGKIALIDRGGCSFTSKVKNAQNAGATAVIIANNVAGVGNMGGTDPSIVIPAVSVSLANGSNIKTNSPVVATLGINPNIIAGADAYGRARLYTPNPVRLGSGISHFDPIASRNLLMEPSITSNLTHDVKSPNDLTLELLRDVGWFPDADLDGIADDADCEPNSDLSATVMIMGCDTRVPNTLFSNGCTISDQIRKAAQGAQNHGDFVSAVTAVANSLKSARIITGFQQGRILSCAAGASIP